MKTVATTEQCKTIACPKCKRAPGRPCRKIGTGGALAQNIGRVHEERRAAYLRLTSGG